MNARFLPHRSVFGEPRLPGAPAWIVMSADGVRGYARSRAYWSLILSTSNAPIARTVRLVDGRIMRSSGSTHRLLNSRKANTMTRMRLFVVMAERMAAC